MPDTDIPTLILDVTEAEADKLLATIDPLAAMEGSDGAKLDALLREVETSSEALASMFTDLAEDAGILESKEIVEDEVPEAPIDPITKPGDLWLLGEQRLLCGDSTKAEDVERLMAGEKCELCFTSPPYNLGKSILLSTPNKRGVRNGKTAYTHDDATRAWTRWNDPVISVTFATCL